MSSPRSFAFNAGLNLVGLGLPLLAAIPAIPLLVAGAGAERFGLLTIAWALLGYLAALDLGMGRALTFSVADRLGRGHGHEIKALVRSALLIAGSAGVLWGALLFATASWIGGALVPDSVLQAEVVVAVRVVGVAAPLVVLATALQGVLEGLQRFGVVNTVRVGVGTGTFLGPLAVLPFSSHLGLLVGMLLVARALGFVAYAGWVARVLAREPGAEGGPVFGQARALLRYGGWVSVTNVVSPLMEYADRVAIGVVVGTAAVAFYTTPFEVIYNLLIIPSAIVAVFFPIIAQRVGSGARRDAGPLVGATAEAILLILVPFAVILFAFAPEGLRIWVGEDFALRGSGVTRWLVAGMLLNAVAHVPFALIQGLGRPRTTAAIHLFELPLFVVALLWALPRWGILGAAVVWTGRVALDLVLMSWAAWKLAPEIRKGLLRAWALTGGGLLLVLPTGLPASPSTRMLLVGAALVGTGFLGWARGRTLLAMTGERGRKGDTPSR